MAFLGRRRQQQQQAQQQKEEEQQTDFDPFYQQPGSLAHFYHDPALKIPLPHYLDVEESDRLLETTMATLGRGYAAAIGAGTALGVYNGLRYGESGSFKIRLNAVLNATGKRAIKMANSTAILLLMYQSIDLLIGRQQSIPEEEDANGNYIVNPLNEEIRAKPEHAIIAGGLTGALFRSPGGVKKAAIGACLGLVASALHCVYTNRLYVGGYFDEAREKYRLLSEQKTKSNSSE